MSSSPTSARTPDARKAWPKIAAPRRTRLASGPNASNRAWTMPITVSGSSLTLSLPAGTATLVTLNP